MTPTGSNGLNASFVNVPPADLGQSFERLPSYHPTEGNERVAAVRDANLLDSSSSSSSSLRQRNIAPINVDPGVDYSIILPVSEDPEVPILSPSSTAPSTPRPLSPPPSYQEIAPAAIQQGSSFTGNPISGAMAVGGVTAAASGVLNLLSGNKSSALASFFMAGVFGYGYLSQNPSLTSISRHQTPTPENLYSPFSKLDPWIEQVHGIAQQACDDPTLTGSHREHVLSTSLEYSDRITRQAPVLSGQIAAMVAEHPELRALFTNLEEQATQYIETFNPQKLEEIDSYNFALSPAQTALIESLSGELICSNADFDFNLVKETVGKLKLLVIDIKSALFYMRSSRI